MLNSFIASLFTKTKFLSSPIGWIHVTRQKSEKILPVMNSRDSLRARYYNNKAYWYYRKSTLPPPESNANNKSAIKF